MNRDDQTPSGDNKSTRDPKSVVRRRRQLHRSGKLHVPVEFKDSDFIYRWVIDSGDRSNIKRYQDYGYTIEDKKLEVGDGTLAEGSSLGSTTNTKAGGGGRLVLMKIPKDLYDVGLEEKERDCKQVDESLKKPDGLDPKLTKMTQTQKTE